MKEELEAWARIALFVLCVASGGYFIGQLLDTTATAVSTQQPSPLHRSCPTVIVADAAATGVMCSASLLHFDLPGVDGGMTVAGFNLESQAIVRIP